MENDLFHCLTQQTNVWEEPVFLTLLRQEDAHFLWEGTGDLQVVRLEPWGPYTETQTEEMVARALNRQAARQSVEWTIWDKTGPRGLIHLNHLNFFDRTAEIGYWLARTAWGQGYATAAVRAVCCFAQRAGFRQIEAICHPENAPSHRVLEKNQFFPSGRRKDYICLEEKTWDGLLFCRNFFTVDFP